jgi:cell filamentation protein
VVISVTSAIHSFREGNTGAQFVFFSDLARNSGYSLDLQALDDERGSEFVAARFHGHGSGHYGRLTELLTDTVSPRGSLELTAREHRGPQA